MGLYLRKSVKVGPLRFNLSGSGIGISGGVRGFRVGTGPRGNYVHMGRHGLYYRSTLSPTSAPASPAEQPYQQQHERGPQQSDGLSEIDSGSVEGMTHSSSAALLEEIRSKRKMFRIWPIAVSVGGVALLLCSSLLPWWGNLAAFVVLVGLAIWLARRDVLRKTVVLMYEFDAVAEAVYQGLQNGVDWLANAARTWHLEAQGGVSDWKKNAGATSLVRRKPISISRADPPDVKTNIGVPVIPVGRQRLYLLPDRILVYDGRAVGAVGYDQLSLEVGATRFIEEETVPQDAEVVGSTWKYVNKKGGPDRRFKDNRELPILLYGEVHFKSATGLNEVIQVSNTKAAEHFAASVTSTAAALSAQAANPPPVASPSDAIRDPRRRPTRA